RFSRDWSSDVCSSDLTDLSRQVDKEMPVSHKVNSGSNQRNRTQGRVGMHLLREQQRGIQIAVVQLIQEGAIKRTDSAIKMNVTRSEERRVGKEGEGRW